MGDRRQDVLTGLKAGIMDAWRKAGPPARARSRPGPEWATVEEIADLWGLKRPQTSNKLNDMERDGRAERRLGHPRDWWRLI